MLARSALVLLLTVVVGACAAPPAPAPDGPLPFVVVETGQIARYDRRQPAIFVLSDASAFRGWWSATVDRGDPEAVGGMVDFGRELAIAVFQGQRPTGGYGIEVRGVRRQGTTVRVMVETRTPPPRAVVPQVITSPYQIVKVSTDALPDWQQRHYVVQTADGTVLAETSVER
ncbi:MAG: protease complex subunit PrcB family protein [Chloroflexi bacterium]|nr:protease complex subunit PrcB family protein [Chloroflexota bacterium]